MFALKWMLIMMCFTSYKGNLAEGKSTACSAGEDKCGCELDCSKEEEAPVCGMDGTTYKNQCQLSLQECETGATISKLYDGQCNSTCCKGVKCSADKSCIFDQDGLSYCIKRDCPKSCPPGVGKVVCGADVVTYDSECHILKTACDTHKIILQSYEGKCGSVTCDAVKCKDGEKCVSDSSGNPQCIRCPKTCAALNINILCGSDGITYKSWCKIRVASCESGKLIEVVGIGQEDCNKKAAKPKDTKPLLNPQICST